MAELLGNLTNSLDNTLTGGDQAKGQGGLLDGVTSAVGKTLDGAGNVVGQTTDGVANTAGQTTNGVANIAGGLTNTAGGLVGGANWAAAKESLIKLRIWILWEERALL